MAPNKLENQIRETLNSREIKPSAQAWDRLDAMLTATEMYYIDVDNLENKKKFPWLMVAAIFIGFVFVGTIFFKTIDVKPNVINENNNVVVTNENETPKIVIQKPYENVISSSENIAKSENINSKIKTANFSNKTNSKNQINNSGVSIIKNNQNQVANINNNTNDLHLNEIKKQDFISNQNQIANVPDDNLNQEKENNIPTNMAPLKKINVDASSLLSAVDKELTNEYRETVFQKIGKNFQAARVAFAERNIKK